MRYALADIRRHFSNQRSSGLSVPAYCQRHRVNAWTFRGWKKRQAAPAAVESPALPSFVKVDLPTAEYLEIITPSRATIRIPAGIEAGLLRLLLGAIKRSRIV